MRNGRRGFYAYCWLLLLSTLGAGLADMAAETLRAPVHSSLLDMQLAVMYEMSNNTPTPPNVLWCVGCGSSRFGVCAESSCQT